MVWWFSVIDTVKDIAEEENPFVMYQYNVSGAQVVLFLEGRGCFKVSRL